MDDPRFLDLARRIVRTPSVTTDGTFALATFLAKEVLSGSDLDVRMEPGSEPGQVNLVATKGLDAEAPILLNSHLDTVPPGDRALWTACDGDPFSGKVDGERLYGLGSADAKVDWLCKAWALLRFGGRRFRRGVVFAGTFGEESGLLGARALLGRWPRRPIAAWAGEPTALGLVTRHKGLLVVSIEGRVRDGGGAREVSTTRLRITGRAAHSSTPELGENAICRALDFARERGASIVSVHGGDAANKVPALCEMEVEGAVGADGRRGIAVTGAGRGAALPSALQAFLLSIEAEVRAIALEAGGRDETFSPPVRTANLGRLDADRGGVRLVADVRCLPGERADAVRARLETVVAGGQAAGVGAALTIERDNPPLATPADSEAVLRSVASLAALGLPTDLRTKAGCTEAGVYAAAGVPAVVFGPGVSAGNIHAPNEHVAIAELDGAVEFYTRLLQDVCLG